MTRVDDLADVRAGDKGDTLMLAVFPRNEAAYRLLLSHLTASRVAAHFGDQVTGEVVCRVQQRLPALVFTIPGVLADGVTGSTTLDGHGKTLSYHLLGLEIPD